jgi:hypothetical protein
MEDGGKAAGRARGGGGEGQGGKDRFLSADAQVVCSIVAHEHSLHQSICQSLFHSFPQCLHQSFSHSHTSSTLTQTTQYLAAWPFFILTRDPLTDSALTSFDNWDREDGQWGDPDERV